MKSVVTTVDQPSRDDVLATLGELLDRKIDREQASAWANRWLAEDHVAGREVRVTDQAAWRTLTSVAGADTYGGDRPYLYDNEDFAAWVVELMASPR
jgi:hypothetical protein